MALVSVNPATGEVIARYRPHTRGEIEARVASAAGAAGAWRGLGAAGRARHLRAFAAELRRSRGALAAFITAEMGRPLAQAGAEVDKCADALVHYARVAGGFLRPEAPAEAPRGVRLAPEPLGVILGIMPWNYPLWQVIRAAAPALSAGNVMLVKHASNTTGCALALAEAARRAGLPAGVLDVVLAPSAAVPGLVADERVGGVTLTGGTAAGRVVAAAAGAALKPCVLELGGSDPYLIFPDADLAAAAAECAAARLVNNGQSCVAAKRFIAHAGVAEEFTARLAEAMAGYVVGAPTSTGVALGPLAREDARAELHGQVTRSVRRGARLVLGGRMPRGAGFYYPPTLLAGVGPGMPAADEELFGPVAAVETAADEAAMIAAANRTVYGLGAAIFSRDARRAGREVAPRLRAGMVYINHAVRSHVAVPFGGTKASGLGRELGRAGVQAFCNVKTVWTA